MHRLARLLAVIVVISLFAAMAEAQRFEIDPYVGGFFSGKAAALFDVKNQPMYGLKAGAFANRNFEVEGHVGYINDLAYEGTLTRKRAYIWEGLATYNLSRFYGSYGLGGVTTTASEDSVDFWGASIASRSTFLAMSYGGGIKTFRKWGPIGYRLDVRGRTLPNYNGFAYSWLEVTGGLTFSWGERPSSTAP